MPNLLVGKRRSLDLQRHRSVCIVKLGENVAIDKFTAVCLADRLKKKLFFFR